MGQEVHESSCIPVLAWIVIQLAHSFASRLTVLQVMLVKEPKSFSIFRIIVSCLQLRIVIGFKRELMTTYKFDSIMISATRIPKVGVISWSIVITSRNFAPRCISAYNPSIPISLYHINARLRRTGPSRGIPNVYLVKAGYNSYWIALDAPDWISWYVRRHISTMSVSLGSSSSNMTQHRSFQQVISQRGLRRSLCFGLDVGGFVILSIRCVIVNSEMLLMMTPIDTNTTGLVY